MAHDNTEIEIKVKVDKETFLRTKEKLKEVAKLVKNSVQADQYFTPGHKNFLEPKYPFEWLSIRKRGDKSILNYKHWYPANAEIHTHCDEYETEVKNSKQIQNIFSVLGLKELITVKKKREEYEHD